jgi:hypothetical protein
VTRRWIGAAIALAAMVACSGATASAHGHRSPSRHAHPAASRQTHPIAGVVPDLGTRARPTHARMAHAAGVENSYDGPVLHWNRSHLIFWAPSGSGLSFETGYQSLMARFLTDVAADSHKTTNVYGLSGQYFDANGPAAYDSTYAGSVTATDPLPGTDCAEPVTGPAGWSDCVTDADLQNEIDHVVVANNLPETRNDIYFIVLPDDLGTCTDANSTMCALGGSQSGFCGYHSETEGLGVLYAVIPYNAVPGHCQSDNPWPNDNAADPAISTLSHEHNETVTDPDPYGSWIDSDGNEIGDLCITDFGRTLGGSGDRAWNEVIAGGHFFLQEEWSNASNACEPRAPGDQVSFTVPAHPHAGVQLKITGRASAPQGKIVSYLWTFGDGRYGHRRVTGPTFKSAGTYRVVLRATDSWGNWAVTSRTVRILPAAADRSRRHAPARPH